MLLLVEVNVERHELCHALGAVIADVLVTGIIVWSPHLSLRRLGGVGTVTTMMPAPAACAFCTVGRAVHVAGVVGT